MLSCCERTCLRLFSILGVPGGRGRGQGLVVLGTAGLSSVRLGVAGLSSVRGGRA